MRSRSAPEPVPAQVKAVELISRILSLQLAGNSSVIITDRTLVHRFHGLRDVKIINVQRVQGMSKSGAVGDRM